MQNKTRNKRIRAAIHLFDDARIQNLSLVYLQDCLTRARPNMASTVGAHSSFFVLSISLMHLILSFFEFLDIVNTDRITDALKYEHPAIDTSPSPKPGMTGNMFSFPR